MKYFKYILILLLINQSTNFFAQAISEPVANVTALDMKRVAEISQLLPETTKGIGNTYKDREVWGKLYNNSKYKKTIVSAEKMLETGFPVWDQKLYDGVFTKGDTQSGKDMINNRLKCLSILVWAECLENKGRFVNLVHDALYDIMKQKTWVNPKHYDEKNYGGLVELATALNANCMAQAVYLLDDKLAPQVKKDLIASLYTRAFNPLFATLEGKNHDHWWLTGTLNWNAVCLEGVTCAALTLIPDRMERAKFVAIAERYSKNYVAGFLEDGYCTEGIGYYNFGMGHFIVMREKIWQDTKGKIDLFNDPKIFKIATFLPNMEIMNEVYPSIADCDTGIKPSKVVLYYMNKSLGLNPSLNDYTFDGNAFNITDLVMCLFPIAPALHNDMEKLKTDHLRSYFNNAGVLVVRPQNTKFQMGAALKGGNNNEHHNHNDISSYTLVVGKEIMIEDPGLIPYNIKTFSPERYTAFKTLASYGHPVPLVAGKDQIEGKSAQAVVVDSVFSNNKDIFKLDISSAYPIPDLKKLTREYVYVRKSSPSLVVKDEFAFSSPYEFETALITRAQWKITGKNKILLERNGEKVCVTIDAPACGFEIKNEEISEKGKPYTRLGLKLKDKLSSGFISVKYTAVD